MKRLILMLLVLSLLPLAGCRARTSARNTGTGAGEAALLSGEGLTDGLLNGQSAQLGEGTPMEGEGASGDSSAFTMEDPSAARREYDDQADTWITPGTMHAIHREGEGDAAGTLGEADGSDADLMADSGRTATQLVPAGEAERKGTSDEAEVADTFLTYYSVLLEERVGRMFECQRKDLYWETPAELRTVFKTSPEHGWILEAGCYDVSARLLEENLTVDAGWVQRKNPGVIVKIVDRNALGFGVADAAQARSIYRSMLSRPDWAGIDAVRSGRVLLASEQLLASPHLRTALVLYIAKLAAPDQFEDVDPEEALRSLAQEAGSMLMEDILFYKE